jgi:hypothetical protein
VEIKRQMKGTILYISNGSYKIKELDGRILKTPVNGEFLGRYNDRKRFSPMVLID